MLTIRCSLHPRYQGAKLPKNNCEACKLLFVLANQDKDNQLQLLEQVGSVLATTVGGDKWSECLECFEVGEKSNLRVKCCHHGYQATRKPGWKCDACWLLFVLKYQTHPEGEKRLGSFNPYAYVIGHIDLKSVCANLKIIRG